MRGGEEERRASIWRLRDITELWWSTSSLAGGVKRREICFLSSSILSVFVQTSCISSTSCLLPVLTDGCFSLICTLPWPALPRTPPSLSKTFREKANLVWIFITTALQTKQHNCEHFILKVHLLTFSCMSTVCQLIFNSALSTDKLTCFS